MIENTSKMKKKSKKMGKKEEKRGKVGRGRRPKKGADTK